MPFKQSNRLKKPLIFTFQDYRAYLHCYFEYLQNKNPSFSYRGFAKKAGLATPNYLPLVLQGKRAIGPRSIEGFIDALELNSKEALYFKHLVQYARATDADERRQLLDNMDKLRSLSDRLAIETNLERYLSHWIYPYVREAAQLPEFSSDPHWLVQRTHLPLTPTQVQEALAFLLKEGFLIKTEHGFEAADGILYTKDQGISKPIQQYHAQIMTAAIEAQSWVPIEAREYRALTMRLPAHLVAVFRDKLQETRDELLQMADEALATEDATTVVQINMQMFPLIKTKPKTKKP